MHWGFLWTYANGIKKNKKDPVYPYPRLPPSLCLFHVAEFFDPPPSCIHLSHTYPPVIRDWRVPKFFCYICFCNGRKMFVIRLSGKTKNKSEMFYFQVDLMKINLVYIQLLYNTDNNHSVLTLNIDTWLENISGSFIFLFLFIYVLYRSFL